MKVYRGYDKQYGPITHNDWIYVTPNIEQAKYYATKDGDIKDGGIIEYDMDKENMHWISLDKINSYTMEEYNESYTTEDLLWYQEDIATMLDGYKDGIYFTDPYNENHIIYIVLDKKFLKNPRELSKEEFDTITLNESLKKVVTNEDDDIFEINSINDVPALLRNCRFGAKAIYNTKTGHMFAADNLNYIHDDLSTVISNTNEDASNYVKLQFYDSWEKAMDSEYVDETWGYSWFLYSNGQIYIWLCKENLSQVKQDFWNNYMKGFSEIEPDPKDDFDDAISQVNESFNLKNGNRLAGFYFVNDDSWEMLPRTDKDIDWGSDEAIKYAHNSSPDYLEEVSAIRFAIEDVNGIHCVIESPEKSWIKPFVKELIKKFPKETVMIKQYDLEWYDNNGKSVYKSIKLGENK